jgi:acylphosphatase
MREAERLELDGFARNLPDGSVEVVSDGPEEALEAMEAHLRRGPPHARVDDVARLQAPVELQLPRPFDIR